MIGVVLAAAAIAALSSTEEGTVQKLADALREALPSLLSQFAREISTAALTTAPLIVPPAKWALFGAAVISREAFYKSGGWALRPPGPAGTGDPSPRWRQGPPGWADDLGLLTGKTRVNQHGVRQYEVQPPTAGGATVAGWGYGLAQVDWEMGDREFVDSGQWKIPSEAVMHLFKQLRSGFERTQGEMQDRFQRTADQYNAGQAALDAGDPDSVTTGKDYGADVLARAAAFEEDLPA